MPNDLGKLRRSMVMLTFGPGSVVDFRVDHAPISAVVSGLETWDQSFWPAGLRNQQTILEPRLQRRLGVKGFRLPPVIDEDWHDENGNSDPRRIIAVRFPDWLQCPQCDRIAPSIRWGREPGRAYRYCPKCTAKAPGQERVPVIPVRFIMACEDGHLDDFPWHYWVGHKANCSYHRRQHRGFLKLESIRPGLSGLIVSCPECGASHSMDGIFSAETWATFRCNGRRPWLAGDNQECNKHPRALQRGASNLYFPVIASALSIPPWSDRLQEELGIYWNTIVETEPQDRVTFIKILAKSDLKAVLSELQITPDELAKRIEERLSRYSAEIDLDIRQEEYRQFTSGVDTRRNEDREFEIRNVTIPDKLQPYFNRVARAVRLREVRVISGFTRVNPPGDDNNQIISPLSTRPLEWLPAIEVRGEGIFLELKYNRLTQWEQQDAVQQRAELINKKWRREWRRRFGGGEPPRIITPRFLLVHTFAHALMRQLSIECGYSSASLRERLYVSEGNRGMAGLLVYTATSDSDGTLGGLQRQGEANRLLKAILSCIKDMEWCSSDPICISGMIAAPDSHSLAACHACCLAPETACEEFNRFLDRALIVGLPDFPGVGFFSQLLREL